MQSKKIQAALVGATMGFLFVGVSISFAQPDLSNVEIKTHEVKPGIYMLEGKGGNIGVSIGDDGVLLIDDQFEGLAAKIQTALESIGGSKPDFIINTHWHQDHTGANPVFGKTGHILAHTNVRDRLMTGGEVKEFGMKVGPMQKEGLPVITYEQGLELHFNGEDIKVWHLPTGHTDGDSVVLFKKSNVVHMGDLMFAGMFPFVDLGNGGDVEGYVRNVGRIINAIDSNTRVIPGHGPRSTYKDLQTWHAMLQDSVDFMKQQKHEGVAVEDIQAKNYPKSWKDYDGGFITTDAWLATLYKSVQH